MDKGYLQLFALMNKINNYEKKYLLFKGAATKVENL